MGSLPPEPCRWGDSMPILIALPLAALIVWAARGTIKRRAGLYYGGTALVAVAAAWGTWRGAWNGLPGWCAHGVVPVFTQGALAMALFFFVMFAGAAPNGSAFMRWVMPIRGELSILASILAVGHGLAQLKGSLDRLLAGAAPEAKVALSLAALTAMLPLFATSFKRVRRRMEPRRWKRLQRLAYGFYALAFVHILWYNLPRAAQGVTGAQVNVIVYGAVFVTYGALRLAKAMEGRATPAKAFVVPTAACCLLALVYLAIVPARHGWLYAGQDAVEAQDASVDAVSGATTTSGALIDAIASALEKAAG